MLSSKLNSYFSFFFPLIDQSMLEALGGPGEKSILSQKRRMGNGDREEEKHESLGDEEVQVKRENDKRPESHDSQESENESSEGRSERKEENEEEKREHSEEYITKEKKGKCCLYACPSCYNKIIQI